MTVTKLLEGSGVIPELPSDEHRRMWVILWGGGLFRPKHDIRWGVA